MRLVNGLRLVKVCFFSRANLSKTKQNFPAKTTRHLNFISFCVLLINYDGRNWKNTAA